jgi:TDG/mug DNA glycosylase family protein
MTRIHSFAPIEDRNARTLILGTMPGAASLVARQYYAHPRNLFWTIIGAMLGITADAPYAERTARLIDADIALWDVLKTCTRPGSLDANIAGASVIANDFAEFFASHPRIERICFNGARAATLYHTKVLRTLAKPPPVDYLRLPSTSPAHASVSAATKTAAWRVALDRAAGVT